jgi:endo-1,4-beta-xylanase
MLWGFWENRHWRPQAALFASDWTMRPHGQAWMDLVNKQWKTDASATTDADGSISTRGFLGDYQITVTHGQRTKTAPAQLDRDGETVTITLETAR